MQPGREFSKKSTSVHQTGVTTSGSQTPASVSMPAYTVSTSSQNPHMLGEDDSHRTLTGPGMGGHSVGAGVHPQKWGHTAPSGSRVEINDTPGGESISVVHHSGAGFQIDPDGSVFVTSTSRRGGGIAAPLGDLFISAGGEIVIDGPGSLSIKTAGDLTLDVGGTLNIVAGAVKMTTKALDETIDGSASRSVTNDLSTMIGGVNRMTVAGDQRTQVAGVEMLDVGGNRTTRIDGSDDVSVKGDRSVKVTGKSDNHSTGDMTHVSAAKMTVDSAGNSSVTTGGTMLVGSDGNMTVAAEGTGQFGSKGDMAFSSDGTMRVSGATAILSSEGQTTVSGASAATIGGPVVKLATGSVLGPIPSGSGGSVSPFADAAPSNADRKEVGEADAADYPPSNDVIDSMTTVRKHPNYPGNGVHESAVATNYNQIDGDESPGAEEVYNEFTRSNQGNANPSSIGGSIDTLPQSPTERDENIEAVDPNIAAPSRNDNSAKISKYYTLGALTRAKHSHPIPNDKWQQVVKNHILVAYNVLDQIKEAFPDIIITSAYRSNSGNHVTGRAVDIVCPSRSATIHAEIARFARDKLPCEKILLERNDTGRTHVHLQVTPSGQKSSNPSVYTCRDKKCKSRVEGIDLEWLERRA